MQPWTWKEDELREHGASVVLEGMRTDTDDSRFARYRDFAPCKEGHGSIADALDGDAADDRAETDETDACACSPNPLRAQPPPEGLTVLPPSRTADHEFLGIPWGYHGGMPGVHYPSACMTCEDRVQLVLDMMRKRNLPYLPFQAEYFAQFAVAVGSIDDGDGQCACGFSTQSPSPPPSPPLPPHTPGEDEQVQQWHHLQGIAFGLMYAGFMVLFVTGCCCLHPLVLG